MGSEVSRAGCPVPDVRSLVSLSEPDPVVNDICGWMDLNNFTTRCCKRLSRSQEECTESSTTVHQDNCDTTSACAE